MSGYRLRPYLPAVVGPRAAWFLISEFGDELERSIARLSASPYAGRRAQGAELAQAVEQLREAARQWRERRDADEIAADGNAAMPRAGVPGSSELPPSGRLTVDQVAERTGLGRRQVRNLCRPDGGPLSATKVGGVWLIDEGSVRAFVAARRPVA